MMQSTYMIGRSFGCGRSTRSHETGLRCWKGYFGCGAGWLESDYGLYNGGRFPVAVGAGPLGNHFSVCPCWTSSFGRRTGRPEITHIPYNVGRFPLAAKGQLEIRLPRYNGRAASCTPSLTLHQATEPHRLQSLSLRFYVGRLPLCSAPTSTSSLDSQSRRQLKAQLQEI
ncbi:hypothetical protein BU23DRAFT_294401 [Bimuria novae-zelandiae CBS 107.79]|uniref:Uncharacterized protein n=1 Tax=Bimuria novae-zelandiae CBS 107.79 TaxID=1447943 RepID=A0A6A5VVU2_9PLEO|nr:hypothetical protein BU23DRAFT_294401 [Bimuria novae-zelandiae CBS 107.79]